MMKLGRGFLLAAGAATLQALAASAATLTHTRDPNLGTESWQARAQGVSLQVGQLLPEQIRAFWSSRGFDAASVEYLSGGHCFFWVALRNESGPGAIRYDLRQWRVRTRSSEQTLKLVSDWMPEWERRGLPEAQRTAFAWALMPTEQEYEVGDWGLGMVSLQLPHSSRFDLHAVWQRGSERHALTMPDLRCAADVIPPLPHAPQ